jgi:hypothetical protein
MNKVHYSHIVSVAPSVVPPQKQFIYLACCDLFQAVQNRMIRIKQCVPRTLHAVVCFSNEKECPTLHPGLSCCLHAAAGGGRDVVVTAQNPGTVCRQDLLWNHMVRPFGVKRAKAAARSVTIIGRASSSPIVSEAAGAGDKLSATLGKIFCRAKKKDSFKMMAKTWEERTISTRNMLLQRELRKSCRLMILMIRKL